MSGLALCPTCGQDVSHAPNHVSEDELAAIIGGQGIVLTYKEAVILRLLLKYSPSVVPYERVVCNVYPDPDREPEDALGTVKIFTCHLNKKLAGIAKVEARWGIGYRLVAQ